MQDGTRRHKPRVQLRFALPVSGALVPAWITTANAKRKGRPGYEECAAKWHPLSCWELLKKPNAKCFRVLLGIRAFIVEFLRNVLNQNRTAQLWPGMLLAGLVILIYSPALTAGFVSYDDPEY